MPQIISEERKAYNKAYYQLNKCEHNRQKSRCKECGGSEVCTHNRRKSQCKECFGGDFCEHNRIKTSCKECGGSRVCEHNRQKSQCKECGGSQICEHNKRKSSCKDCNPMNCLISLQRSSIRRILLLENLTKLKPTIEYLGCSAEYFLEYLQNKMIDGMTFHNIHIDHIKPVSRFNLQNEDEFLDCCHYTNLQPLFAQDNLIKHNKWNGTNEEFWRTNIKGKEYLQIYNPLD